MNKVDRYISIFESPKDVGVKFAYFNRSLFHDKPMALEFSCWGERCVGVSEHTKKNTIKKYQDEKLLQNKQDKIVTAGNSPKTNTLVLDYWKKQLQPLNPQNVFTSDRDRHYSTKPCVRILTTTENEMLFHRVKKKCTRENIPLYDFLYSAFVILVGCYSGRSEIVVGAPGTERYQTDNDEGESAFNNILILNSSIRTEETFSSLLEQNRKIIDAAVRHRCAPIDMIFDLLGFSDFSPGEANPLFQVMFSFAKVKKNVASIPNNQLEQIDDHDDSGQLICDLDFQVIQGEKGLYIRILYNSSVFESASVERITTNYFFLIKSIIDNFHCPINQLEIMPASERRSLIEFGTEQSQSHAEPFYFIKSLQQRALKYPSKAAIKYQRRSISYQCLNRRANRFARHLLENGARGGSIVAIFAERAEFFSPSLIISVMKIGAVYLPIDTSLPEHRIRQIFSDTNPDIAIAGKKFSYLIEGLSTKFICLDDNNLSATLASYCSSNMDINVSGNDTACILYNHGASGHANTESVKGVVITHRGINNRLSWFHKQYPLVHDDICCISNPPWCFDYLVELLYPLSQGCSCVLLGDDELSKPEMAIAVLALERVTRLVLTAPFLKTLLRQANVESLSCLKLLLCSGEYFSVDVAKNLFDKLPKTIVVNIYSVTEAGAVYYELDGQRFAPILDYFTKSNNVNVDFRKGNGEIQNCTYDLGQTITKTGVPVEQLKSKYINGILPSLPISVERYMENLEVNVIPYMVNVSAKKYIGHMTSALPNFVPQLSKLITFFNQNMVKVETSKSLSLIERQVLAMTHRLLFSMPDDFYCGSVQRADTVFGVVASGGSVANITALLCARNAALMKLGFSTGDIVSSGANQLLEKTKYNKAVILCSRLAHYSVKKSALLLGIGEDNIIVLPQDKNQKVSIDGLRQQIARCFEKRQLVICIIGIAGATETGTVDPLTEMAKISRRYNIHFHVDAAWGGAFKFSHKHRHKIAGCELADSITFCAHKQLYLPQGISVCAFRDIYNKALIPINANYQAQGGSYDLGQYSLEGSRPALSLLLHAAYHLISESGYEAIIDNSMSKTAYFTNLVKLSDQFELVEQPELNIVNYRYIPKTIRKPAGWQYSIEENRAISNAVKSIQQYQFEKGDSFVSKTTLIQPTCGNESLDVFRVVLSNPLLDNDDLHAVLQDQVQIAAKYIEKDCALLSTATASALTSQAQTTHQEQVRSLGSQLQKLLLPIGKPIDNVTAYVLDSSKRLVPVGAQGVLYLGGDGLAKGYLSHPPSSSSDFVKNPFSDKEHDMLFRTGDVVRWTNEGNLEFLRYSNGATPHHASNFNLAEIELHLEAIDGVDEAAVISHSVQGEQCSAEENIEACLVLNNKANKSRDGFSREKFFLKVRNELRRSLPCYTLPVCYRLLKELPHRSDGKYDKIALCQNASDAYVLGKYIAPANSLDKMICETWRNDLQVVEVGVSDNYLNLGGDSSKAEITAKNISKIVNLNITSAMLLKSKNVDELSCQIRKLKSTENVHIN